MPAELDPKMQHRDPDLVEPLKVFVIASDENPTVLAGLVEVPGIASRSIGGFVDVRNVVMLA
jgi:hypothetical protein